MLQEQLEEIGAPDAHRQHQEGVRDGTVAREGNRRDEGRQNRLGETGSAAARQLGTAHQSTSAVVLFENSLTIDYHNCSNQ